MNKRDQWYSWEGSLYFWDGDLSNLDAIDASWGRHLVENWDKASYAMREASAISEERAREMNERGVIE